MARAFSLGHPKTKPGETPGHALMDSLLKAEVKPEPDQREAKAGAPRAETPSMDIPAEIVRANPPGRKCQRDRHSPSGQDPGKTRAVEHNL